MKKIFHFTSATFSKQLPIGLFCGAVMMLLFGILFKGLMLDAIKGGAKNVIGFLCGILMSCVGVPWLFWVSFTKLFIYEFSDDFLILKLFYGKEVARYTADAVESVTFQKKERLSQLPNLILRLKDGRVIKFDFQMEKYPELVDEVERWSGITLPNKEVLLKGRTNECLVVTKL